MYTNLGLFCHETTEKIFELCILKLTCFIFSNGMKFGSYIHTKPKKDFMAYTALYITDG